MAEPTFDQRLIRVGIQVNKEIRYYEDLDITVTASKNQDWTSNEGSVRITNLTKDLRDKILTENRLYNRPLGGNNKLVVDVGRASYGLTRLFVGNIRKVDVSQPPDIALSIDAYTGAGFAVEPVSMSASSSKIQLKDLSAQVAKEMGLALAYEADDKLVGSFSFTGVKNWLLRKLSEVGNVNAFIDNDTLVVKSKSNPLKGSSYLISPDHGMIGAPALTEKGVNVKTLFHPALRVGGSFEVKSELNPAANGKYQLVRVSYSLQNRGQDFYCDLEGISYRYFTL